MHSCLNEARVQEQSWVEHSLPLLGKEELTGGHTIAWASYHTNMQHPVEDPPAQCVLLPLFYETSATPAMTKNVMDVIRQAIQYMNRYCKTRWKKL